MNIDNIYPKHSSMNILMPKEDWDFEWVMRCWLLEPRHCYAGCTFSTDTFIEREICAEFATQGWLKYNTHGNKIDEYVYSFTQQGADRAAMIFL